MRLPNFLIIGAMKCGTTSLHRYLGQHPQVFTTAKKEVDFFARSWRAPATLSEYAAHFEGADDATAVGESSTNYMKEHRFPGTAERIASQLPEARLICVLRDPVDRVLSHYQHNVWRGREQRPFVEAVEHDEHYVTTSRYAWQLGHYLTHVHRERLLILTAEQLRARPHETVRRALRFLELDDTVPIDVSRRYNVTDRHNRKHRLKYKPSDGLRVIRRREGLRTYHSVALTSQMRARLADRLRDDVLELQALVDDDLQWDIVQAHHP